MTEIHTLLHRVRAYEIETQSELEHVERLRRIAARTRGNTTCSAEYAEKICEKLAEMERELNAQVDRTADAKREALVLLSFLEGEERAVIERYYFLAEDWRSISYKLYMSERRVFLLRKSALEKLEKRFGGEGGTKGGKPNGNRCENKTAS